MGFFNNTQSTSLIRNEEALDFEFVPKLLKYREKQQHYVAGCIKPLLENRTGRNLFIYGGPGIGKTAAIKWILRDLEETSDDVVPIYLNCWQKNTTFKIFIELCNELGYKFTHNKKTDELLKVLEGLLNKKPCVLVFDEVDKVEDFDFLYNLLESIHKKTILLITNHKVWLEQLDQRIASRLLPDQLEFKPYSKEETHNILKQRIDFAFHPNTWDQLAIKKISEKTFESCDIRVGIKLLREAGLTAEAKESKKILPEYAEEVISKLINIAIKKTGDLEEELQVILEIIKNNSGNKIGDLFRLYLDQGADCTYKTFQRRINKLSKNKFIATEKLTGGAEGTTTIVKFENVKKLTDF